jgi:hypothetical protein
MGTDDTHASRLAREDTSRWEGEDRREQGNNCFRYLGDEPFVGTE